LRTIHPCPNLLDLAWYLRGCGDLAGALRVMDDVRPLWSGTILCLQGRLTELKPVHWEHSRTVAQFLMGKLTRKLSLPYLGWGESLLDEEYLLRRGRLMEAREFAGRGTGGGGLADTVRSQLVLAEVERQLGNMGKAREQMELAERWILSSGSVEHLLALYLLQARLQAGAGGHAQAWELCQKGIQLAQACGFGILHIDLCLAAARMLLAADTAQDHRPQASDLIRRASWGVLRNGAVAPCADVPFDELEVLGFMHPQCQYAFGRNEARALAAQYQVAFGSQN
jgi:hypothetical protein